MNKIARTFVLVGILVCILLAMHLLPKIAIDDNELRKVNLLSDVMSEPYDQDNSDVVVAELVDSDSDAVTDNVKTQPAKEKEEEFKGEQVEMGTEENALAVSTNLLKDFSEGKQGGMAHFFNSLKNDVKKRPVRIAYFGDSFIEGDILTCDLRELLQTKFGGNGVGWVDCKDRLNGFRKTVKQKSSGITEFVSGVKYFSNQFEGINERYFVPIEKAQTWASASKDKQHLDQWQNSSIYFKTAKGLNITTFTNKDTVGPKQVKGGSQVQVLTHEGNGINNVGFQFNNVAVGTYLYGMALESRNGVILDNFSMRGSSGLPLSQIPDETLSDFANLRNYDLIVLHYGLNMTSDKAPLSVYQSYTKRMEKVIAHLREAYPHTSVLVVSIPDRCQRTAGGIKTMQSVETMVNQQKLMASNSHVAFFDLFTAMGGKNSMKRMVEQGYAGKDYTHITFAGGKMVAKHIFDGLMEGYEKYQNQQK